MKNSNPQNDGIMFFDYPPTLEEFKEIISNKNYQKFHFMKEEFNPEISNYIKKISGMAKYAHNKKEGHIDIQKMADILGVTKEFVQVALEIFDREKSIAVLNEQTLEYIKPISDEAFRANTMYEVLSDEFNQIMEFKNFINNAPIDEIKNLILQ